MYHPTRHILLVGIALSIAIAACGPFTGPPEEAEILQEPPTEEAAAPEEEVAEPEEEVAEPEEEIAEPEEEAASAGPAPQPVEFETEDGVTLAGTYYPPLDGPAPIVVLMHWAAGDQNDWVDVVPLALILQDPSYEQAAARAAGLASYTYARMQHYGVLTFNFRGYPPSGDAHGDRYLDAQAAVQYAKTLDGVDPHKILTVGASIGADGAVDGCIGAHGSSKCIGAVALSPGSYIGMEFMEAALNTGDMPILCVVSKDDGASLATCMSANEAVGPKMETVVYDGGAHGMDMFDIPDADPPLLDHILNFLDSTVEAAA